MSSSNTLWSDCPSDDDNLPPIPTEWKKTNFNNVKKTKNYNKKQNPFSLLFSESDSDTD